MFQYNTIEEALEDLRQGRMILCTDDPDRENEGDLICAAEFATTENVNFMATHAKGLICMPMSLEYVRKLQFPQMVTRNTVSHAVDTMRRSGIPAKAEKSETEEYIEYVVRIPKGTHIVSASSRPA